MCDICKSEKVDYRFKNGAKTALFTIVLYNVYRDSHARAVACYIHSIELFMMGEKRFLQGHLPFARKLAKKARPIEENNYFSY
jgi:hypothetical protein